VRLPPDHPGQEEAEEIIRAAERGAAFTRKLLAFSGRSTHAPQVLDAHEIVLGMELMLQRLMGDGIELRLHARGPTPYVLADASEIEQVLLNLVVNARDAMPQGGAIDVTVDIVDLEAPVADRYAGLKPGRYAHLSVRDTGKGIAPELQARLFEPFFTTKNPAKGSGLGLSIVYNIVKDAEGAVAVSSAVGRGSTFDVLLPLADLPSAS
jgi:two-component system cell cycle sensor histidine kinase/response regulator CckA